MMRIALMQYQLSTDDWNAYIKKVETWVVYAKNKQAHLIVFPEYAGIEIGKATCKSDADLYLSMQPLLNQYIEFFQKLAHQYQMYIIAGTILASDASGKYFNRSYFFSPSMKVGYQDKQHLTEYEKSSELLVAGSVLNLFETQFGKMGIAICYDSEFPEIVRSFIKEGAWLIVVPTFTTTMAGYYRVSLSSRARAIENQCYVATSCMVGTVRRGTINPEETFGNAGIYSPADIGFPEHGIVAEGSMNQEACVISDIYPERIKIVRKKGQVHNYEDAMTIHNNTSKNITCFDLF